MSEAFGRRCCAGAILATALCLGTSAQADGIPAYVDGTGWHLLSEQAQHAVVVVHDDTEHLFLRIALQGDLKADQVSKLIWLTPIPAPASTVHVDILRGVPRFWGIDPVEYAKSTVRDGLLLMGVSQLYTLLPALLLTLTLGADRTESDVVVHERLVRDGVEVEVVSADSPQALAHYLKREEIELPRPALQSLGPYTGSSSCFTLVRIVDLAAYQAAVPSPFGRTSSTPIGVEVSFPTREGFFPLVASSALPGDNLRVVVTAPGFHEPTQPAPAGLITTSTVRHH